MGDRDDDLFVCHKHNEPLFVGKIWGVSKFTGSKIHVYNGPKTFLVISEGFF